MTPNLPSNRIARRRGYRLAVPAWDARRILAGRADELGLDLDEYVARLNHAACRRRETEREG